MRGPPRHVRGDEAAIARMGRHTHTHMCGIYTRPQVEKIVGLQPVADYHQCCRGRFDCQPPRYSTTRHAEPWHRLALPDSVERLAEDTVNSQLGSNSRPVVSSGRSFCRACPAVSCWLGSPGHPFSISQIGDARPAAHTSAGRFLASSRQDWIGTFEPKLPDAAQRSNGSNVGQSGPSTTALRRLQRRRQD